MWMLNFIPDAWLVMAVHAITAAGAVALVIGSLTGWIPGIKSYAGVVRIIGTVLLCAGLYFEGGVGVEMSWRARVAELEAKVREAEAKSAKVNTVIQEKVVYKTRVIKEKEYVVQEKIKEVEKVIDAACPELPAEAIDILNQSAQDPTQGDKQ
jgi:hypothetical protein